MSSDQPEFGMRITVPDERIPLLEICCRLQHKLDAIYSDLVKSKQERAAATPRLNFSAEPSISDVLLAFAEIPAFVVLLSTGAFSPPHHGHAEMLKCAQEGLQENGVHVLGGFLSPSHDAYVQYKAQQRSPAEPNPLWFTANERCSFTNVLLSGFKSDAPFCCSKLESSADRFLNCSDVTELHQKYFSHPSVLRFIWVMAVHGMATLPKKFKDLVTLSFIRPISFSIRICYVCGADHVKTSAIYNNRQLHVIAVSRALESVSAHDSKKFCELGPPLSAADFFKRDFSFQFFAGNTSAVSSTLIVAKLKERRFDDLHGINMPRQLVIALQRSMDTRGGLA